MNQKESKERVSDCNGDSYPRNPFFLEKRVPKIRGNGTGGFIGPDTSVSNY